MENNQLTYNKFTFQGRTYGYYPIQEPLGPSVNSLPYAIRVLLEGAIRHLDHDLVTKDHIHALRHWTLMQGEAIEIPYQPGRIILQDFTGVPAVVDLAVMRDALEARGANPEQVNPKVQVDLVIDHSVMVDFAGTKTALDQNVALEFERNQERYSFIKWAQETFDNFSAIPPATGIIHQVNLEYLAQVVLQEPLEDITMLYPDTLVGTDSHTTMINGLGVLGFGVGGIEAEASMLGQPLYFNMPKVVGVELVGAFKEGTNATDLALVVTETLRNENVVGQFVEYFGSGLKDLTLQDRATVANMAPEYGATVGFFPVDEMTLEYLRLTGRNEDHIALVKAYYEANHMFRSLDEARSRPQYTKVITIDLAAIDSSLAGPKRPQDRVLLKDMKQAFETMAPKSQKEGGFDGTHMEDGVEIKLKSDPSKAITLKDGSVVLAAITSCTNTSNPTVMIGAGLLAKKAVEFGLVKPDYVKSSLTPGSKVVTDYLDKAGLIPALETLGFHVVGYGCATCIGNSGPLDDHIEQAIDAHQVVVASVLSGNRNFEGRIHPKIKANYLASPILVMAYALAGTVRIDFETEPLGHTPTGKAVYLKDVWPSAKEIETVTTQVHTKAIYEHQYGKDFLSNRLWEGIESPKGACYPWVQTSSYIQPAPYFENLPDEASPTSAIHDARILAIFGDSVTTDHISPAGSISMTSPAGSYLESIGIPPSAFNSYGSRRGNHHVMMRGTFANIRIRNRMLTDIEGGYSRYQPTGEVMSIYDVAMAYQASKTPLIVLAGAEYGTGSSRDWAAKGTALLGVKAVIAKSYERIHRSNLVGMGVLPLQWMPTDSIESLGLEGDETLDIVGLKDVITPMSQVTLRIKKEGHPVKEVPVICRLDSEMDITFYQHGGILQKVIRDILA